MPCFQAFHFDLPPAEANRVLKSIARGKQTIFSDARTLAANSVDQADKQHTENARDETEGEKTLPAVAAARAPMMLAEAASAVALALSNGLPRGLCVKSVTPAPGADPLQRGFDFHARESCRGKRYVYTIAEGSGGNDPFLARQAWALGYGGSGDSAGHGKRLNVAAMQQVRDEAIDSGVMLVVVVVTFLKRILVTRLSSVCIFRHVIMLL